MHGGRQIRARRRLTQGPRIRHRDRRGGHALRRRAGNGRSRSGRDRVRELSHLRRATRLPGRSTRDGVGLWRTTRQHVSRRFRDDGGLLRAVEARNQADLLLHAADFVPGQPQAVGGAQAPFAVVFLQLLGRKHVLAHRHHVLVFLRPIEIRVDRHGAVHHDRLVAFRFVEHHAAREAARRTAPRRVEHGVGPHGDHPGRRLGPGLEQLLPRRRTCRGAIDHKRSEKQQRRDAGFQPVQPPPRAPASPTSPKRPRGTSRRRDAGSAAPRRAALHGPERSELRCPSRALQAGGCVARKGSPRVGRCVDHGWSGPSAGPTSGSGAGVGTASGGFAAFGPGTTSITPSAGRPMPCGSTSG